MQYTKAIILALLMMGMTLAGCTGTVTISDVDGDGVYDALDLCPNTPPNTYVDATGCRALCPDFKVWDDLRDEFDLFGSSVATDGRTVIVGANGNDVVAPNAGKAFVFICTTSGWTMEDELLPTSIALTEDDNFGHSVSILGDYAIVGAPNRDSVVSGTTISDAGAAFVFKRGTSGIWSELAVLTESTPNHDAHFGWSVDLSNSNFEKDAEFDYPLGTFNAVVGAPTSNAVTGYMSGAAYFFTTDLIGVEFALSMRLEANSQWHDGSMCGGCGTYGGPWNWGGYGADVAIYRTTAVVGSPIEQSMIPTTTSPNRPLHGHEIGAAYIFEDITTGAGISAVKETIRVNKPDAENCNWQDPANQVTVGNLNWNKCNNADYFGHAVDIYDETVVIGEPGGPMSWGCWGAILDSTGATYVFEKTNVGIWDETLYAKLSSSVNTEYNFPPPKQAMTFNTNAFGWDVSIWRDLILVGSPVRDGGYYYGPWANIYDLDIGISQGDSLLFLRNSPLTWNEVAIITIPDIIYPANYIGFAYNEQGVIHNFVAIGGKYVVMGSNNDDIRPVNWIPYSTSATVPYWPVPGGPPNDMPDPNNIGKDTGSAYICYYDSSLQVYCDWSEETNPGGSSFSWGSYTIANDNQSDDDNVTFNERVECPYEDINICRIMGYLYSEEFAPLHEPDLHEFVCSNSDSNRTNASFNEHDMWGCFTENDNGTDDGDGTEGVSGCTDPDADNYDEEAEVDDDSCTYGNDDETEEEEEQSES